MNKNAVTVIPPRLLLLVFISLMFSACNLTREEGLEKRLAGIVGDARGIVGIAVITPDRDTVAVSNDTVAGQPLMSVFKLHQSIALSRLLDKSGTDLDTLIRVSHSDLNPETWSPLLLDYPEGDITLPLTELLDYLLLQSDNNVSNILFDSICSVAATDSIIRSLGIPESFALRYTEHEMQLDHAKAKSNWSSPIAAAALIDRLFTDSLVSQAKSDYLRGALRRCITGIDRIPAPFVGNDSVTVAHRTGSGYVNERGEIAAVNDVAYITLPDGRTYTLAVFVSDYSGTLEGAEKLIATVSAEVYDYITGR